MSQTKNASIIKGSDGVGRCGICDTPIESMDMRAGDFLHGATNSIYVHTVAMTSVSTLHPCGHEIRTPREPDMSQFVGDVWTE